MQNSDGYLRWMGQRVEKCLSMCGLWLLRMNIPEAKMYNNIKRYGNTTTATIPIALDELLEKRC